MGGTTFPVLLVARMLGRAREDVERRCRELTEREQFLQYAGSRKRPSGTASALYGFTHALYHSVIYERVGEAKRRRLHQAIGERLEQVFQGASEQVAAELALHFERTGDFPRAVRYITQAAQKATQQSAYQEATEYSTSGLKLLQSVPDNRDRAEMELRLLVTLGVSLASTRGYSAAEVEDVYDRATWLHPKVKDELLRIQTLTGLTTYHIMRGNPRRALDFAKQMILAAQSIHDRAYLAAGHTYTGIAHFYLGEFPTTQEHFDQAFTESGLDNSSRITLNEPYVPSFLLTYTAITQWLLGYPAGAEEKRDQALSVANQLSHPLSLTIAPIMLASYHQCRGEVSETLKLSEQGIKWAVNYGLLDWLSAAKMLKGWALANLGQLEKGISLVRDGLKDWRAIGSKTERSRFMYVLADVYLLASHYKEGLSLVDEALSLIEETEDRFYQSELTRLRGELLLKSKPRAGKRTSRCAAETQFLKAIEIAQRQEAKSFELRATISLARLWQQTGKEKEAKRRLAKIYGWFTEGFDTPDLKAAKELLDKID